MSVAFWLVRRNSLASSSDAQTPSEIRNAASAQAEDNHGRILRRALALVNSKHRFPSIRDHTKEQAHHVCLRNVRVRSPPAALFRSRVQGRARPARRARGDLHHRAARTLQLQCPALPALRRVQREERPAENRTGRRCRQRQAPQPGFRVEHRIPAGASRAPVRFGQCALRRHGHRAKRQGAAPHRDAAQLAILRRAARGVFHHGEIPQDDRSRRSRRVRPDAGTAAGRARHFVLHAGRARDVSRSGAQDVRPAGRGRNTVRHVLRLCRP